MITFLDMVAISDFVLAAFCLFLGGYLFAKAKSPWSRIGLLSSFLFFAGLSAFMGGIDHGFFEPIDRRYIPRTMTYLCIAASTFFLFRYTILTFTKGIVNRILNILAFIQLVEFIIASFFYHNFLLVIANFSPILIFFFIFNLVHIKSEKSALFLSLYCIIMIIATLVQVIGINLSPLINEDTFSHFIAFFAYIFMFSGIRKITN